MQIRVLGSGAGGGFPQWNCSCPNCKAVRAGTIKASTRNQSSIAVSSDGEHWALFNASPDVRAQLEAFPEIHPKNKVRGTGIEAIVMFDSQIDHATGLLILREGDPLTIYCTDMVKQDLTSGFPIFNILEHFCGVEDHPIPLNGDSFTIPNIDDLEFTALPLKSKAPPYSPHRNDPHEGDNIGMIIRQVSTGKTTFAATLSQATATLSSIPHIPTRSDSAASRQRPARKDGMSGSARPRLTSKTASPMSRSFSTRSTRSRLR